MSAFHVLFQIKSPQAVKPVGFLFYGAYASISVPLRKRKLIRPSAWTVTVSMTVSQSLSSKSVRASSSCTSNMNAPMASAWASRAPFVVRSCSSCAFVFSNRSTKPLYRAAYSSWFCAVCEFSAMQRFVSSVTTSISSSRLSISASIPAQSVSVSLKSGVDVRTLSETLGHFSAGFTLSTYVHSTPGMKQSAADAIGNTIRNAI